jgi:hypothetical protein
MHSRSVRGGRDGDRLVSATMPTFPVGCCGGSLFIGFILEWYYCPELLVHGRTARCCIRLPCDAKDMLLLFHFVGYELD